MAAAEKTVHGWPRMDTVNSGSDTLEAGTLLAERYLVEFVLGKGGMGAVYFARDQSYQNEPVALKEMRVQATDSKSKRQAIDQFRQEARFLTELDHPNLVKVSDFFVEGGLYYLAMSYIKGKTLAEMLKLQREPFAVERVLEWAAQLLDVLAYLHRQDPPILFRDMKPSNIILDTSGSLHLIDFGIARSMTGDESTGTFLQGVGSADYCPLEQYSGAGGTDQRSDIYSLGATLYHLLTLQVPPRAAELASKNKSAPTPRRFNANISPALEDMVVTMMAVRKDDRYGSVKQVQAVLAQVLRSGEKLNNRRGERGKAPLPETKVTTVATPGKDRGPWIALGGLTLVVLGLLLWLAVQMTAASH